MVAANPTKTTAAKAAAGTCLSEAPAEVVLRGDGLELESEVVELESAPEPEPELDPELDPEPEVEPEVEVDSAVLVDFEPVAVVVVLLEPEVVEEVSTRKKMLTRNHNMQVLMCVCVKHIQHEHYIPTLCPLASQVSKKCFKASCLSSPSHLSEIVSWILSPFLMQIVFRSAGLGSALYVTRSLAKDPSDLPGCR